MKQRLLQRTIQKFIPQQIQFSNLLQTASIDLPELIAEELIANLTLEEDPEDQYNTPNVGHSKISHNNPSISREMRIHTTKSRAENLTEQIRLQNISDHHMYIARYIIGCLDQHGYLSEDLSVILDDLTLDQYIITSQDELITVIKQIQKLDPPGIGAMNTRECLLIQLERKVNPDIYNIHAQQILRNHFDDFIKKRYKHLQNKLAISTKDLQMSIAIIQQLNPFPGSTSESDNSAQILHPDFIVNKNRGKLQVTLTNERHISLRVSKQYETMLTEHQQNHDKPDKEVISFLQKKISSARWFIQAIKQRRETLLKTMEAIVQQQEQFFKTEDPKKLRPMILQDIADIVNMDPSTISRIVNNKNVQACYDIYPLKFFFSQSIGTDAGKNVSNHAVKQTIKELIDTESNLSPLSDEKLAQKLKIQGYRVARRTVTKYREQLQLPIARLRRKI